MAERIRPPAFFSEPTGDAVILDLARVVSGQIMPDEIPASRWRQTSREAIRNGLGPLLWWKIEQWGGPVLHSAAFQELANTARIASFDFQIKQEEQAEVQLAMAQAGIPAIWLKGIALAQAHYPQPHLRPMNDLDLWVPYEQCQTALAVVHSIGFHTPPPDALSQKIGLPEERFHHYHLIGGPSDSIHLELHFRLLGNERLLPLQELGWFWQESELAGQVPIPFQMLKPEAHFLYLCAHAILQHGEGELRLQRFYDLHLLANQTRMDWDLIVSRAVELGWTYVVERAILVTCHYFATPIPKWVVTDLSRRRKPGEESTRARRLQSPGHRWEKTLEFFKDFSWSERLRQIFHLTFPPPEYMRARYAIRPGRVLFPYYVFRWLDAGVDILRAVFRRLA